MNSHESTQAKDGDLTVDEQTQALYFRTLPFHHSTTASEWVRMQQNSDAAPGYQLRDMQPRGQEDELSRLETQTDGGGGSGRTLAAGRNKLRIMGRPSMEIDVDAGNEERAESAMQSTVAVVAPVWRELYDQVGSGPA